MTNNKTARYGTAKFGEAKFGTTKGQSRFDSVEEATPFFLRDRPCSELELEMEVVELTDEEEEILQEIHDSEEGMLGLVTKIGKRLRENDS